MTGDQASAPQTPGGRSARANDSAPLPYARQWIDEDDIAAVASVLRSDFVTQGPAIEQFEAALSATTGARHAVAVSSGTAALHLVCAALEMRPGWTGITSPITFVADANCFLYTGARAAFVDVDPQTGLMSAAALDRELRVRAKAGEPPGVVIAVSLGGRTAGLPALESVCSAHGWTLVEDAAHSLGATYRAGAGVHQSGCCTHSRAAILSFHPVKHVCAGEGGAVLTNDDALAARIRLLRSHGIGKPAPESIPAGEGGWWYEQTELGYHYRMTEMQAALGASQLSKLPKFLERRRALARRYASELAKAPFARVLTAPAFEADHAYHLFPVHFKSTALRRRAYDWFLAAGIRTQVHYIPVYRHPHYRRIDPIEPLTGAEAYYSGCLSLPLFPKMTAADQERVIGRLREFAKQVET